MCLASGFKNAVRLSHYVATTTQHYSLFYKHVNLTNQISNYVTILLPQQPTFVRQCFNNFTYYVESPFDR